MVGDQPPVRVEVSRPRLVEGGSGVLRVRVVNVSGESITCTLGMQGALTDAWRDTPTVLAPGRKADRGVTIKDLARGLFVVHVSVDVEWSDGATARFVGQVDREVDALASGPAINNVQITGDATVLSDVTFFPSPERKLHQGEYEEVELAPSSVDIGLNRVTLADRQGPRLHVITGDRIVIGRDHGRADVLVSKAEETVSRVHVEFEKKGGEVVLHHRSGTNTTLLCDAGVTEGRPVTLGHDDDFTLVLGGTWKCRFRVFRDDVVPRYVGRGLIERGVAAGPSSAEGIAAVLFTPENQGSPESMPVLWLCTAVRLCALGLEGIQDQHIVLSAFYGLQEIRLADDGRVLSLISLCVNKRIADGRLNVVSGG